MNASSGRILVLIGALLLALGTFLPLVTIPLRGTLNLFQMPVAGVAGLAFAGIALVLAALDLNRHALWPAIGSLAMLGYGYIKVQERIEEARQGLHDFDFKHPLRIIRGAAASGARLDYGWAVLGLGALLTIAGSIMAWREGRQKRAPRRRPEWDAPQVSEPVLSQPIDHSQTIRREPADGVANDAAEQG
jgi:hypothetical protein